VTKAPRIAIIGGSKEAIDLARIMEHSKARYCLFETPFYPSPKGIATQQYNDSSDWSDLLCNFDVVVFAPHPFAFDLLKNLRKVTVPMLALLRPVWVAGPQDRWQMVPDAETAAQALRDSGAQMPLLALGRERLAPFIALPSPQLLVRCRNLPLPDLQGRGQVERLSGPVTTSDEIAYMQERGVDCIVVHNAGGRGGWPKLEAARHLGIPVIMIDRPAIELPEQVTTPEVAISWLRHRAGLDV